MVSYVDLKGGATSTVTEFSVSPMPQSIRAVLPHCASLARQPAVDSVPLLQQVLQIATRCSDLNGVLTELATTLGKAFRADGCLITLSPEHSLSRSACWLAGLPTLSVHWLQACPNLFAAMAPETGPISLVDSTLSSPGIMTHSGVRELIESWQIEPLRASSRQAKAILGTVIQFQGRVHGVISLMRTDPYLWTESDADVLQTVSHQVAIAIAHLQLQEQFAKQAQYQAVVNQLTMAIRNSFDLHDVLRLATAGTAQALQVQRGMLLRLKYWDPLFRSRAQEQMPKIRVSVACEWVDTGSDLAAAPSAVDTGELPHAPSEPQRSFWMSECALCQKAFLHSANPVVVSDRQLLPSNDVGIGASPAFNLEELPAILLAPLESQGTVLGFLAFQHHQPRLWQAEELEFVRLVSAQVSTAMIQTETLKQVQALVEKRTAELRESLSVQAKLYERTRQQLDQLRRLNQLKDEFLSTVSHELRTPLTSMTMAIRMLRQKGLSGDRSERYLDILEQQCAQETNLINDLLALQELESNQVAMQFQELDLEDLIQDVAKTFRQKWTAKGLTLAIDLPLRSLRLRTDRESLNRILLELLTNAGKYSEPNSCIHLRVVQAVESSGGLMTLTLSNMGPGISPEELPFIFDKFRRCQGSTQNAIQGTGLGLALVKSLVQHLNGTITASSHKLVDAQTCETCFTLTLSQT